MAANVSKYFTVILLGLLLLNGPVGAQGYFKWLEAPERSYDKRIGRFPNGDLLIGDTAQDDPVAGNEGGVTMSRLDPCGNTLWAHRYNWGQKYLEFKDFAFNDAGDIFVYGSAYELPEEYIFIMKLDRYGIVKKFRLFESGTIDHFTYTVSWDQGHLMIYGLLLGWLSQKEGFVVMLDEQLDISWSTRFAPFASFGEAIITRENSILCRSGVYLVKLSEQGDFIWGTTLESGLGISPLAGPLEVAGGYIFEFYHNDLAFLYKLDHNGQLLWKSQQFLTTDDPADLSLLEDGTLLATYSYPTGDKNIPALLLLSPEGNIVRQQKLLVDEPLNTGRIYQSPGADGTINLLANADLYAATALHASGFLLQFPLDSLEVDCFQWVPFQEELPNDITLNFSPLEIAFSEAPMPGQTLTASMDSLAYTYREICELNSVNIIHQDSVLSCNDHWKLKLPGPDFSWEDGTPSTSRLLTDPGIYRANNHDCLLPVTYEYELKKESCNCSVFLPNAFSPNDDGINDQLECFSDCTFLSLDMAVYNRWGDQVFYSTDSQTFWNGKFKQQPSPPGIYVVNIRYQLQDANGQLLEGQLAQDVMLLK